MTRDFAPRRIALALVLSAVAYVASSGAVGGKGPWALGITVLVATLWLGNAIPIAAASLIPLAAMPLSGVLTISQVGSCYADPVLWMLFGGFILALGVERWNLHRRIALYILRLMGTAPARLVLGLMIASAVISMWISNTATTLILMPIALALVAQLQKALSKTAQQNFSFALLLGIAYGASIGGIGTPIGTAPNALFFSSYAPFVRVGAPAVSFVAWMLVALPLVVVMIPLVWLLLTRVMAPLPKTTVEPVPLPTLPAMTKAERRMLGLFLLAAALWITRADVDLGRVQLPGWWRLFPVESADSIGDGAVSVLVAILAFVVPSGLRPGQALMDWNTAKELPWDILLLIGGGIAIARAFSVTGLAEAAGTAFQPVLTALPALAVVGLVCLLMTFLSEVTSNTAIAALFLPILVSAAAAADLDPRLLMLPATWAASCGFMLPIATPPNAIVFASGHIPMGRMARAGFWVNLIGVVCITAVIWWVAVPVWGIDVGALPSWARGP